MARSKTRLAAQDSLSNLAASLGAGKDKAASDAFFVADLPRDQIEAMYRGDWLARKIVDIVPYDSIREWREWAGEPAAVAAIEAAERRLGLRKAVQRAMVLGRLYGGGAIIVGTAEDDPAHLGQPLYPEAVGPGGVRFLHAVSRWQLSATDTIRDPLDPFFGEPVAYEIAGDRRAALTLHPSRVVRFLGNPLPDPQLTGAQPWSDSVLQSLYDAVHAVAVTGAGATSLVHEAKVDIVTVPNLSEHLSNAATTAQLSARFSYAAAMKSINNLLLLGDGETWSRQSIDFGGLPEMVRTFLQVAAGAADIPVTRLLGQSPAGLSATGDSDTRNYYDMISARQELDLRPQLERLDALLLRSAGVDPGAVRFEFRPLWQLTATEKAQVALQKAQTTAVYAGLNLWPVAVTGALVRSQLMEDGTYPGAATTFGAADAEPGATSPEAAQSSVVDFDPAQPRDPQGRWTSGSAAGPDARSSAAIVADPGSQIETSPPGAKQKRDRPNTEEDRAFRWAVNLAVLPIAARGAVLSLLQTVTNLLGKKPAEPASEKEPFERLDEPADQGSAGQDPYAGNIVPLDRSNLESKIKNYLLRPEHDDNKGKAQFYETNLGFTTSNWQQLADQIKFNKNEAVFDPTRTGYGDVHYDQNVKVTGPNGRTMTLKGKFAITNGIARLITLLPD